MFIGRRSSVVVALATNFLGVQSFAPSSSCSITRTTATLFGPQNAPQVIPLPSITQLQMQLFTKTEDKPVASSAVVEIDESSEGDWIDESKRVELILLGLWGVTISAFILVNNFYGPWPLFMKQIPERTFFLCHMIGGMLFGGGIILTTLIERAVAKSNNASVLQFWFDKVPEVDGLVVVPALTLSMISGTGLSIVRYGGLNIAPPHVDYIFWTLIAFMTWWATTDLTTQGTALKAVERMYENGETDTPKVVLDRHVSNVVSCFFILLLYSMMVFKPGTIVHFKPFF